MNSAVSICSFLTNCLLCVPSLSITSISKNVSSLLLLVSGAFSNLLIALLSITSVAFALFTSFLVREIVKYGNEIKNMIELKIKTKEFIDVINNKLKLYNASYPSKKK